MIDHQARLTSLVNPEVLKRLTRRVVSSSSEDCLIVLLARTAWPMALRPKPSGRSSSECPFESCQAILQCSIPPRTGGPL